MTTDNNHLSDDVIIELNGERQRIERSPVPDRPADSASKAKWVEYVVALGADRTFVEGTTVHYQGTSVEEPDFEEGDEAWDEWAARTANDQTGLVEMPGLTVAELRDLADRLGG